MKNWRCVRYSHVRRMRRAALILWSCLQRRLRACLTCSQLDAAPLHALCVAKPDACVYAHEGCAKYEFGGERCLRVAHRAFPACDECGWYGDRLFFVVCCDLLAV